MVFDFQKRQSWKEEFISSCFMLLNTESNTKKGRKLIINSIDSHLGRSVAIGSGFIFKNKKDYAKYIRIMNQKRIELEIQNDTSI